MRQINLAIFSTTLVACMLSISSCRKTPVATEDTGYASDHAVTEQTFNDVQSVADQASTTTGSMTFRTTATTSGPCANVTHSGDSIIIDFGSSDCLCRDGRLRRGRIIVTYTGRYADSGSTHTITFDNYYQNDNKVTGTKTVTNMGHNSSGFPWFSISINGAITRSGGGTISVVWTRTRTWTAGYTTLSDLSDDVYQITGTGSLTRANGSVVGLSIPSSAPLVVALNCHWIEAGSVDYTLPGGLTRTLDYGDTPNCDNQATLKLPSGKTYNITLP
jgi:hypothetical protein